MVGDDFNGGERRGTAVADVDRATFPRDVAGNFTAGDARESVNGNRGPVSSFVVGKRKTFESRFRALGDVSGAARDRSGVAGNFNVRQRRVAVNANAAPVSTGVIGDRNAGQLRRRARLNVNAAGETRRNIVRDRSAVDRRRT